MEIFDAEHQGLAEKHAEYCAEYELGDRRVRLRSHFHADTPSVSVLHGALRLGVGNNVSTINAGDRHDVAARFA